MDNFVNLITAIINQWDPLEIGFVSEDEYDSEVNQIIELPKLTDDANIIAEGIQSIFIKSGSSGCEEYKTSVFNKSCIDCFIITLYMKDTILQSRY